jgi:thiamine-monophosphate kinase
MKLSDVGERALVELARRVFKQGPNVRVGIGDDAAAIDLNGMCLIATTDMLIASSHFPLGTTPEQMGQKAVIANLSDLAAMGAEPLGLIFSVALPRELDVEFVERLVKRMNIVAREYGTYIVGGDLEESDEIIISGAAFGLANKKRLLRRSGARKGDFVAVTGRLGAASSGLKLLLEKLPAEGYQSLIKAQLEPPARVKEGVSLARSGVVTAAIDVTDGLAANLWQLARESRAKIVIDRDRVPEHPLVRKFAAKHGFDVDDFVLFGGEDFELLFTVRPRGWKKVRRALESIDAMVTTIGHVRKGSGVFIRVGKETRPLPDRGYEHFR